MQVAKNPTFTSGSIFNVFFHKLLVKLAIQMDLKEAKFRKGIYRHPWELARLDVVCSLAGNSLSELNEKKGVLLDVGCGDTWFIEQISEKYPGIRVVAIDILFTDQDLKTFHAKYQGTNISVFKTMDDAQSFLGSETAGMVLLLDVIEHIEDDIAFMKWLGEFSCITGDTHFVITVPAYQWLFSNHDIFLVHYRRYTNQLLINNLSKAGYAKQKVGYFFLSLYLARILAWCKEKITRDKKETTGLVEWQGGKTTTLFVKGILMADFYLSRLFRSIGIKLPGLSNYIVCKKSA
jgi:trans-aconitate methyltransferase